MFGRKCARCAELKAQVEFLRQAATVREEQMGRLQERHDALLVKLAKYEPMASVVREAQR